MKESMLSVGIDLGTTTTQMVVSRLLVENTADPFSVPRMEIGDREVIYRGSIHFTPLKTPDTLDAEGIRDIISREYAQAGIAPEQVQTGAVIITGETARKENAQAVLEALTDFAGEFVVATAGPALESVLAARGAGADTEAKRRSRAVLHVDIGGGTSNLALFDETGKLKDTGCLNVGGRLLKIDRDSRVTYVSPVLAPLSPPALGERVTPESLKPLMDKLVQVLAEAVGLTKPTKLLEQFITDKTVTLPDEQALLSFSGGVADLMEETPDDWLTYGDIGVLLGQAIRRSCLCAGEYRLGRETIRATVVGAGSYATELSGSTVYYRGVSFPLQNLPVVSADGLDSAQLRKETELHGAQTTALFLTGIPSPSFQAVTQLAEHIAQAVEPVTKPLVVVLEHDQAKALGQALQLRLGRDVPLVCLDGIHVPPGSFLDIASPVGGGTALPVVVKTLAFI